MADISVLARLLNGAMRNVDLTNNTPVVLSIKVGGVTNTELTKAILDRLVSLQNGTDVDATYHTHDGRYFTESELGSATASSGSDLIGDDATYSNFTPAAATVKGALSGIDSALAAATGTKVKISATDTTSGYLDESLTAGAGLSKSITNPSGNEVLDLAVNVDGSSIEISTDALRVKALGITSAMLAGSIDATKIADGSVTSTEFQYIGGLTSDAQTQLDAKLPKSGGTMTGAIAMGTNKITGLGNGTAATDAINKSQLDGAIAGLRWVNPIWHGNLIDDSLSTPPGSPVTGDSYLVAASATGAWVGLEGYVVQWNGSSWATSQTAAPIAIGTRLGINFINNTAAAGSFASKDGQIATVTNATPGSYAYTFYTPVDQDATVVTDQFDLYYGKQYTYNINASQPWTEFGGTSALNAGIGLLLTGNVLSVNMGAGIVQLPSDEVGIDVHTSGGLMTTVDNSASSTVTAAQLAIKLNGATLTKDASGLKVSSLGITNTELATGIDATKIADGSVTSTEFQYINTLSSNAQDQIDNKVTKNANITGATKTKITYDAKGLVTAGADATTADIADSTNKRYVTDADLVDIGNLSGTNTGDQTITLTGDVTGSGTGSFTTTSVRAPAIQAVSETAGEAFSATTLYAVRYGQNAETAGRLYKADLDATTTDNFYAIGLALTVGALSAADPMPNITKFGPITATAHGFTVGKPVYLSAAGALTSTAPTTANYAIVRVGMIKDANTIDVNVQVVGVN